MKIIRFFKTLPVTIISVIYVLCMIGKFGYYLYTSDGKWQYDKTNEVHFIDKDGNLVTNKEVKYFNDTYYVDEYGQKVVNNFVNEKFYNEDGKLLTSSFFDMYDSTFYFDENGNMVKSAWITLNGKKYFASKEGVILKDGWIDGKYYVDEKGAMMVSTVVKDGSHVNENGEYYFVNDYNVDAMNIKFGDEIKLGKYKQSKIEDGHSNQNIEQYNVDDIEWVVLENNSGKIKMISKYVLDVNEYNYKSIDVDWEDCDLRKWLTEDFMHTAFSRNDLDLFVPYKNDNMGNSIYAIEPSESTYDKIFVLSKEECKEYYGNGDINTGINEKMLCKPTDYAMRNSLYVENGYTNYWLRNNGCDRKNAMNIQFMGVVDNQGVSVCAKNIGIRPVIYVDFQKGLKND